MSNIQKPLDKIIRAMQRDRGLAHSWHCVLATCCMDEGIPHPIANKAAARFMSTAFCVDTGPEFQANNNEEVEA